MPRVCTVCSSPERAEIDAALIRGDSFRNIAERFALSTSALHRHKTEHLPAELVRSQEVTELVRADNLLDQVKELQAKALVILDKAEQAGDLRTALQAIGQARQNLELLARIMGEIQEVTNVNILITSPEWLRLRAAILAAVEPYPEARQALTLALTSGHIS